MLNPKLYVSPKPLDAVAHASLRLREDVPAFQCAERVNIVFITVAEFEDACKEFPILFLKAGSDALGRPQVAPVAVMGLEDGENHFLTRGKGRKVKWDARYMPAFLRLYPFTLAQVDAGHWGMCIDEDWEGWSTSEGVALFKADGAPAALVADMRAALETLESQIEGTRVLGERLMHFGLLEERQVNVQLPNGTSYAVTGFLSVAPDRLAELSKMDVSELHRQGVLYLLALHQVSLGNLQELASRRWKAGLS